MSGVEPDRAAHVLAGGWRGEAAARRAAVHVVHLDLGIEPHSPASVPEPEAEVDIFEVERVGLIETADLLERGSADEEERSDGPGNVGRRRCVDPAGIGLQEPSMDQLRRRGHLACGVLPSTVRKAEPGCRQSDLGVIEVPRQPRHRGGVSDIDVGVHDGERCAGRRRRADVHGSGEPHVVRQGDDSRGVARSSSSVSSVDPLSTTTTERNASKSALAPRVCRRSSALL